MAHFLFPKVPSTTSLKSLEYLSCLFPHIKLCIPWLHTYVSHGIQSLICKKIHAIYSRDLRDVVLGEELHVVEMGTDVGKTDHEITFLMSLYTS